MSHDPSNNLNRRIQIPSTRRHTTPRVRLVRARATTTMSLADAIARVDPAVVDVSAPCPLGRLDLTNPAPEATDDEDDRHGDDAREASGSDRSVGSLEFDDSPLGSACAEGDGDDDEACGRGGGHRRRRGEKRAWSLDEERAFYETYSRSGGRMDVVASTLGGAPFYRDKTLVYKFRMNAVRRLQAVLKTFGLSVDAKNSKEVCAALSVYWAFRCAEAEEGESVRAFGQRLCVDKNGLKLRCARTLRRELRRFIRRPEWQTEEGDEETPETGKMTAKTTKNVDALAATTTTAVDAVVEGMKSTPARTVVDGKSKFVLQLFPLDAETSGRMKARGYNPLMELTFRQKKSVSGLIAHLSEKWVEASPSANHILQLHAFERKSDCGPWNATIEGATALDVFNALGEPACFRVRYAWADRTTALAPKLKTPQQKTVSVTKRKSSSAFTLGGFSVETSAFDPIPGDTPAVKASAPVANASGDLTLSDFQGMGLTNMFAPSMDAHARQPLARLGNSPSKPPPLSRIFASPAKKGKPLAHSDESLLRVLDGIDGAGEQPGEADPALGVITDSLINPGDSLFRDAILGGGDTRSRRRATDATKGPTSFAGMFS